MHAIIAAFVEFLIISQHVNAHQVILEMHLKAVLKFCNQKLKTRVIQVLAEEMQFVMMETVVVAVVTILVILMSNVDQNVPKTQNVLQIRLV
jgi:hypothetical protein